MTDIEIHPDMIQIDATIVAKALKIAPRDLQNQMRDGTVTSRFERGEGADAGRMRLTFFSATRRARFTADAAGTVLSSSAVDYRRLPAPAAAAPDTHIEAPDNTHLDALLDSALSDSFPASDPVALGFDKMK